MAYDLRPASKEQVQSLGGRFVELPVEVKDAEDARGYAASGRSLPTSVSANCLAASWPRAMWSSRPRWFPARSRRYCHQRNGGPVAPGSVIVDLAAERGGNCELTRPGERATEHGVTLVGWFNLASTVPYHASQMYARNLASFCFIS